MPTKDKKGEFDYSNLLKNLTILKNGLVGNGENNKFTDLLTKWINNISDIETIREISANMYYKTDPRMDYYDTSAMFSYLCDFWSSGEHKNKNLYAFFPKKDDKVETRNLICNIQSMAKECLELLIKQDKETFDKKQNELATILKSLYDKMLRIPTFDRVIAANICKMSLHTAESEFLVEIATYFDESTNLQFMSYILDYAHHFVQHAHWGDINTLMVQICHESKNIIDKYDEVNKE